MRDLKSDTMYDRIVRYLVFPLLEVRGDYACNTPTTVSPTIDRSYATLESSQMRSGD